jgi:hypothetical protein
MCQPIRTRELDTVPSKAFGKFERCWYQVAKNLSIQNNNKGRVLKISNEQLVDLPLT